MIGISVFRKRFLPFLLLTISLLNIGNAFAQEPAYELEKHSSPPPSPDWVRTLDWVSDQYDQYGESIITHDSITIKPTERPMALMTERLQAVYGLPITYEDTRHVAGEVEDFTRADGQKIKLIKRRVSLFVNFEAAQPDAPLTDRKKLAAVALHSAVDNYNSQLGYEAFSVVESEKGFHVVARQYVDNLGNIVELKPLLDTPVTIPPGTKTAKDVLEEIYKAIPALSPGLTFDERSFAHHETKLVASGESARSVLDRLLAEIQVDAEKPTGGRAYKFTKEGGYISWALWTPADSRLGSSLNFSVVKPLGTL